MTSVDLDAWALGEVGDITNPAVLVEVRRAFWREEIAEILRDAQVEIDEDRLGAVVDRIVETISG